MAEDQPSNAVNPIELATELTIAWLTNPNVRATAEEVPAFLKTIHATIGELTGGGEAKAQDTVPEHVPAVPVRSSVKPDYIVSLIDGRKLKSLKRHLSTHGLTPKEYRERYGLKPDYPMVAASYAAQRREVAKKIGLGRKGRGSPAAATIPPAKPAKATPKRAAAKRAPRKKAEAPAA